MLDINIVVVYLLHYISARAHYSRVHSTTVPSVACQTTVLDINIVVVYLLTYISQSADYLRVRSSLVPSVACQTTEGKYHSY